jgi:hypothetical protein
MGVTPIVRLYGLIVTIIITTKSTTRQPSLSIDVDEENVDVETTVAKRPRHRHGST